MFEAREWSSFAHAGCCTNSDAVTWIRIWVVIHGHRSPNHTCHKLAIIMGGMVITVLLHGNNRITPQKLFKVFQK